MVRNILIHLKGSESNLGDRAADSLLRFIYSLKTNMSHFISQCIMLFSKMFLLLWNMQYSYGWILFLIIIKLHKIFSLTRHQIIEDDSVKYAFMSPRRYTRFDFLHYVPSSVYSSINERKNTLSSWDMKSL